MIPAVQEPRLILSLARLLLMLPLLVPSAQAMQQFHASQTSESIWTVATSKQGCELVHVIPRYGRAVFSQGLGEELRCVLKVRCSRSTRGTMNALGPAIAGRLSVYGWQEQQGREPARPLFALSVKDMIMGDARRGW